MDSLNSNEQKTNQTPPRNYMIFAIVSAVLFCVPCGIVAIVYASKVNSLWYRGCYEEAKAAAQEAKNWSFNGLFIYLLILHIIIIGCMIELFI